MAEGNGIQTKRDDEDGSSSRISSFLIPVSAAVAVRAASSAYADLFEERVELTSVVYSFQQLKDGVAMLEDGLDPYAAKNIHFPPLTLHFFRFLLNNFPAAILPFFILMDISTAWITAKAADIVWKKMKIDEKRNIRSLVFSLFAFNPITIVSTGILSLTVVQNFVLAAIFLLYVTDRPVVCALLIGAWSSFTIYPFILLSSLVFLSNGSVSRFIFFLLVATFTALSCFCSSYILNGSNLNFIESTYAVIVNFSNIQPNSGLYWYFFVQIFEHFRSFYTISFVILFFFMPIPITLMIRRDAVLHFTIIGLLSSVFFPYPTLNQVSVLLAILPLQEVYKKHFRYSVLVAGTVVSTIVLMPVMWHMWMVSSSGNANFFFGVTIIYNVALINLIMDMIFVYSRRQIDLEYGDTIKKNTKMDFAFY